MIDLAEAPRSEALSVTEEAKAIVEARIGSKWWTRLDQIEDEILKHPDAFREIPTNHLFPNGLYVREVFMKKGDLILTRVHMVEHAFFIPSGVALVWNDDDGWVEMRGYHSGITKPGTRRMILILEDMLFATVHPNPNNERDPERIVEEVTFAHHKLRLNEGVKP
jgi:hypothetical protein